jgi:hypothetical protein
MTQAAKPEQVLEIIPRDASEGVLAEKSGDNNAHGGGFGEALLPSAGAKNDE